MNKMGPQTIHKTPYNLKKLNSCVGCSSHRHAEGAKCAQCTKLWRLLHAQCEECTSLCLESHALPIMHRENNFQVKLSCPSPKFRLWNARLGWFWYLYIRIIKKKFCQDLNREEFDIDPQYGCQSVVLVLSLGWAKTQHLHA